MMTYKAGDMGELAILAPEGSQKITWDPDNPNEINEVKHRFQYYLDQGYAAFHMNDAGGEGKKIVSFNPLAGKIVMLPKLGGG